VITAARKCFRLIVILEDLGSQNWSSFRWSVSGGHPSFISVQETRKLVSRNVDRGGEADDGTG
jgi:hypothetical protein